MEKKFKVKVNDTSEFEFTEDQIDIQAIGNADFHILHEHKSFKASVEKSDFLKRQYSIKINSNIYNINIANDLDLLIEKMGLSLGSAQLINDIKAPMPGLIECRRGHSGKRRRLFIGFRSHENGKYDYRPTRRSGKKYPDQKRRNRREKPVAHRNGIILIPLKFVKNEENISS